MDRAANNLDMKTTEVDSLSFVSVAKLLTDLSTPLIKIVSFYLYM
jgi:hypothetical protein